MKPPFAIRFLEHVAIRAIDREKSAQWYEEVLGLQAGHPPIKAGDPIIMNAGETQVAIFQANRSLKPGHANAQRIDHFAFQVSMEDFNHAQKYFTEIGIPFVVTNHHYVLSLYINDPDGHEVELTTPIN
jgi:catechol-2,3-dioxygenase